MDRTNLNELKHKMRRILHCGHNETAELKYKLFEVQKELDEANDFIAEIKFELDSVRCCTSTFVQHVIDFYLSIG